MGSCTPTAEPTTAVDPGAQPASSPLGQLKTLPLEIRKLVYSHYLPDFVICKSISPIDSRTPGLWTPPALLYASKSIYDEVVLTLYDDEPCRVEIQILEDWGSSNAFYPPLRQLSTISTFDKLDMSRIQNVEIRIIFGEYICEESTSKKRFKKLGHLPVRFNGTSWKAIKRGLDQDTIDIDAMIARILKLMTGHFTKRRRATVILQTHNHPDAFPEDKVYALGHSAPHVPFLTGTIARTISHFHGFNTVIVELHCSDSASRLKRDRGEWMSDTEISASIEEGLSAVEATQIAWFLGLGPGVVEKESIEGYDIYHDGQRKKTSREARAIFHPRRELEKRRVRAQQDLQIDSREAVRT